MKVEGIDKEVGVKKLQNAIKSKISGTFNGWDGDTTIELINGEKWKQSIYAYSYNPNVIIYQSGSGFKVEGNSEIIDVEKVI